MPAKSIDKTSYLKDLALLFAIPAGVAIFAIIIVYTPKLLANPRYDFIYSTCSSMECKYDFYVDSSGGVAQSEISSNYHEKQPTLRYYSVKDDSSKSLTLNEAKHYHLDTSSKSPDGYSLVKQEPRGGLFSSGYSDYGWYLKDGIKKRKIEIPSDYVYYFSPDIKFLGWVKQ